MTWSALPTVIEENLISAHVPGVSSHLDSYGVSESYYQHNWGGRRESPPGVELWGESLGPQNDAQQLIMDLSQIKEDGAEVMGTWLGAMGGWGMAGVAIAGALGCRLLSEQYHLESLLCQHVRGDAIVPILQIGK